MSVRNHRIAAAAILAGEIAVLFAWGRSMAIDSVKIQVVRSKLQGAWTASTVRAGQLRRVEGAEAARSSAVFDGKHVRFRGMIGGIDASGTFYIEEARPGFVDFKLDAGWIIGIYRFDGDFLELCLNPLAPPERLGVPTLPRPRGFDPGDLRHVYVFRRDPGLTDGR